MRVLDVWRLRIRALLNGRHADRDLDTELEAHLDYLTEEHIARGLSPREARAHAMREFGGMVRLKEECRDARGVSWLTNAVQDIKYGVRLLRRTPGFTIAAVVTLALGIGANTAIVSLVNTVMLRTLPVERPEELVFVQTAGSEGRGGTPPYPYFERLRAETTAFAGMTAFAADELRLQVNGTLEQVFGEIASGNYFEMLGVKPLAGRLLTPDDEKLDPPVAVIGFGYWQRRFGGDPDAIGARIAFADRVFTIVGVTPPEFWGMSPGRQVDVILPITQARAMLSNTDTWSWYSMIARLHPGTTAEQARTQADTVFQSFMNTGTLTGEMRMKHFARMELTTAARGPDRLRSRFSKPLYALTLVAALVLIIACVNLGNLLVVRGSARTREFAIRLATGASSGRLLRQLLTETCLLFLMGAVTAVPVAIVVIRGLTGFFAIGRQPIVLDVRYDWTLAAVAVVVSLVAAGLTGLWPAIRTSRMDPHRAMKDGDGRTVGSHRLAGSARILVASQVALSLVLVVGALLFVKTIVNLRSVDPGFTGERVLTMSLDYVVAGGASAAMREQFWRATLERVRAIAGVRAASLSVLTPLSGRDTGRRISVAGFQPRSQADATVHLNHVSEGYFETFAIELVRGRAFTASDRSGAARVAILNEAAADAYFGGRSPIGESLRLGDSPAYEIVGVVRNHKHRNLREESPRFAFIPVWQPVDGLSRITLSVSSVEPPATLARTVTPEVRTIHAGTLVTDVISLDEQIAATLVSERLLSTLASALAVLALGVAAIGLYGVLSYSVARRRSEFGVRLALGARPARIASAIFAEVAVAVGAGVAIGIPLALLSARSAESMLFRVTTSDPAIYVSSVVVLAVVAALAAYAPARRAAGADPMTSLRAE